MTAPASRLEAAKQRGEDLGLNNDEIAFYDALAANESAVKAMGNAELKVIAAELVTALTAAADGALSAELRARADALIARHAWGQRLVTG